jgi:hypothetical protein
MQNSLLRHGIATSPGRFHRACRSKISLVISLIALCAAGVVACGGGSTSREQAPTAPSAPSPQAVPPGRIQLDGNGALMDCFLASGRLRCGFSESGKNAGPGCANQVRGMVRLVSGETEIAGQRWSLPSTRVLTPDEQFTYQVQFDATPDAIKSMTGYRTQPEWANTACP